MTPAVDWVQVFDDLAHLELTPERLAERTGARRALVDRWLSGRDHPRGAWAGHVVLTWEHMTGKPRRFLPLVAPVATGRDDAPPPVPDLDAVVRAWR